MGAGACCDNDAYGVPCGDCQSAMVGHAGESSGRTVDTEALHRAYKSLSFGVLSAQVSGAGGGWPAGLQAAEIYRRSADRHDFVDAFVDHELEGAGWREIGRPQAAPSSFPSLDSAGLFAGVAAVTSPSIGEHGKRNDVEVEKDPEHPVDRFREGEPTQPERGRASRPGGGSGGTGGSGPGGPGLFPVPGEPGTPAEPTRRCCLYEFEYPSSVYLLPGSTGGAPTRYPHKRARENDDGDYFVGFVFKFGATYWHDDEACHCSCCVFKQFVNRKIHKHPHSSKPAAFTGSSGSLPGYREDCVKRDADGDEAGRFSDGDSEPSGGSSDCYPHGWDDAGENRGQASGFPRPSRHGSKRTPHEQDVIDHSCRWTNTDEPGMYVPTNKWFHMEFHFLGRIYDRCRGMRVVETRLLHLERKGLLTNNLTVLDSAKTPPSAESTNADGSPETGKDGKPVRWV